MAANLRRKIPDTEIIIRDALVDFPLDPHKPRYNDEGFIHFGMTYEEISDLVSDIGPDIVGISTQYSDFLDQAFLTAGAVKRVCPDLPVIMGGNPATSKTWEILQNPHVDAVVMGEGEYCFPEIVRACKEGKGWEDIPGMAFRTQEDHAADPVYFTEKRPFISHLDDLPLPAYDLIDMERYFWLEGLGFTARHKFDYPGSKRAVSVVTSRGCPFRCIFCAIHMHMGRRFRFHSPDYVINHLEHLKRQYGVNHIHFEDDNLTLHKRRFGQIIDGLIDRDLRLTWDTPNGIRVDSLNRDLIRRMIRSGAVYITVGIESGCQEVNRHLVKKSLDLSVAEENIRAASEEGLDTHAFYVVGFPGETRAQIETTFAHATRLKKSYGVQPHLGIANPIKGTVMYSMAKEAGWLVDSPLKGIRFHFGVEKRFKRQSICTPEFDIDYLNRSVSRFSRKIELITIKKSLLFLMRNPMLIGHLAGFMVKRLLFEKRPVLDVLKGLFLNKLLYPSFFKRYHHGRSTGHSGPNVTPGPKAVIIVDAGIHGDNPMGGGQWARLELVRYMRPVLPGHYCFITHGESILADLAREIYNEVKLVDYVFMKHRRHHVRFRPVELINLLGMLKRSAHNLHRAVREVQESIQPSQLIIMPNENYSRIVCALMMLFFREAYKGVTIIDNEFNRGPVDRLLVPLYGITFSRLLAASKAASSAFRYLFSKKLEVIYPGVDVGYLRRHTKRTTWKRPSSENGRRLNVVISGLLVDIKRPDFAMQVFARFLSKAPGKAILHVIGEGVMADELKQLAGELNLIEGSDIVFWGHLDRESFLNKLITADILLHPSITESFGRVVVEAQALGVPVIVSKAGALPEVVVNRETGFVVPKDDMDGFVEKLRLLAGDSELRMNMSQKAFYHAEKFDAKRSLSDYSRIFAELLR